jgi:hypothetical protein
MDAYIPDDRYLVVSDNAYIELGCNVPTARIKRLNGGLVRYADGTNA